MTNQEARACVLKLFSHYAGRFQPSNLQMETYIETFSKLSKEEGGAVIQRLAVECKFVPSTSEIVAAYMRNTIGARRTGEEAYGELMVAVRRYGHVYPGDEAPNLEDPLITKCLGVWGSWNALCDSPSDDPGGRMRFIQLYDQLSRAAETRALLPGLDGDKRWRNQLASRKPDTDRVARLTGKVNALPEPRTARDAAEQFEALKKVVAGG